ncbi:receptor-type tyrosine-protein phosphatase alpha-like [Lepeophtheirus salmonis]|uniref:receptor-type tyrosine-protein phosphatase alpha-like n=1 Tax=Lepeophtheirus salmonis TaxID=72036 RepID=UPI003AF40387
MEDELRKIVENDSWKETFDQICLVSKTGKKCSTLKACAFENLCLNRYDNVLPYDHSRVVLRSKNGRSDYINASLVENDRAKRRYILSQGPLYMTIGHFWSMVWHENSMAIVMLNKLMERSIKKCEQYWPLNPNDSFVCKDVDIKIENVQSEINRNYILTKIKITNLTVNEKRIILHFQYTKWPDFGVPCCPINFLKFLEVVRESGSLEENVGPPIVHCSAGIGRSGTFAHIDTSLVLIAKEGASSVILKDILLDLRRYRMGLIQTWEQLKFSYLSILFSAKIDQHISLDFLDDLTEPTPEPNEPDSFVIDRKPWLFNEDECSRMEDELRKIVENDSWKETFDQICLVSKTGKNCSTLKACAFENLCLNRYDNVLPYDHSRVVLHSKNGRSDYINASLVENDRAKRRYILSQGPLYMTIGHFWSMVWHENSMAIVMLNKLMERSIKKCEQYWPLNPNDSFVCKDVDIKIENVQSEINRNYILTKIKITNLTVNEKRIILHFQYTKWPDFGVPCCPINFLKFLEVVRESGSLEEDVGPPVVHCSTGIGRSGTFCHIDTSLVLIAKEGASSVILKDILLDLRRYRMGLIQSWEQLKFSYLSILLSAKIDQHISLDFLDDLKKPTPEPNEPDSSVINKRPWSFNEYNKKYRKQEQELKSFSCEPSTSKANEDT